MGVIGSTLDKYEVLQKVGEGGMATVYRGRHSTLDRIVAIKILHPHLSSSVRNRARFAREVEAIERLRHENILEIFDYSGNDGTDCYLVMEFVEGETLTELVARRGRLPSEVACLIGISLCRALGFAHENNVLHRDVKPDNVMMRVDGVVKLMDFGIARFLDESKVTMTGALVGSPAFMSPEQAKEAPLDQRSDLFSLGTVLFYLVTGALPFTGSNPSLILKQVIEGNRPQVAELTPTMSATLADVIERLMATNADDRFVHAADVERQLFTALDEVLVAAPLVPGEEAAAVASGVRAARPEWSLSAWIRDPEEYEQRLDDHLRKVLVTEGRRLLARGDHLSALRLLNRVLSIDEGNAEVLSLVQGLHQGAALTPPRPRALGWVALLVVGVAVLALYLWVQRTSPVSARPPEVVARPEAPAPMPAEPRPPSPAPERVVPPPSATAPRTPPPEHGAGTRAVRAAPPAPALAKPGDFGLVRLNSGEFFAEVFLEGVKIGETRKDIAVPAGSHDLVLRSQLLFEKTVHVEVIAGELLREDVVLTPKPATVEFDKRYAADCVVTWNGKELGTLEYLQWKVEVERPDRALDLLLACPGQKTLEDHRPNIGGAARVPFTPRP